MRKIYIRKALYSIEDVLSKSVPSITPKKESKVDFDGDLIKMNSLRYETFKNKGVRCVKCGIEGRYFAKEKDSKAKVYHFNLYATGSNGEILMTKKKTNSGDYVPMCCECHFSK